LFALTQLALAGEVEAVRARHCAAIAAFAARNFTNHWHLDVDTCGSLFVEECDNLLVAFDFAMHASLTDPAARIFIAMQCVCGAAGRPPELLGRASALKLKIGDLPEKLQAHVLAAVGFSKIELSSDRFECFRSALLFLDKQDADDRLRVRVLGGLAMDMLATGALSEARKMFVRMQELQNPPLSPYLTAFTTLVEARITEVSGDTEAALNLYGLAISRGEAAGARRIVERLRVLIMVILGNAGRLDELISTAKKLLPSLVGPAWGHERGSTLNNLAMAYVEVGRLGPARDAALEAFLLLRRHCDTVALLDTVTRLALRCGCPEVAAQLTGHLQAMQRANQLRLTLVALEDQRAGLEKLAQYFTAVELERWLARGATLSDEQVDALVRDLPDRSP
jgi:hypothetical protein